MGEAAQTRPKPTLRLTTPRGRQTLEQGGAVKLHAPLVFVGYGMVDAAVGYDDYRGLDVHGKIVVALYGLPKGMDSEIGAHLLSEQPRVAAEHGAAAVVSVLTRASAAGKSCCAYLALSTMAAQQSFTVTFASSPRQFHWYRKRSSCVRLPSSS